MENATIEQLRNAVTEMDGLAQSGFSEIAAIARLALYAMENPMMSNDLDVFAIAFNAIWSKAKDIENCINVTAETVGCNSVDEAQRRRWDAQWQKRKEGRA